MAPDLPDLSVPDIRSIARDVAESTVSRMVNWDWLKENVLPKEVAAVLAAIVTLSEDTREALVDLVKDPQGFIIQTLLGDVGSDAIDVLREFVTNPVGFVLEVVLGGIIEMILWGAGWIGGQFRWAFGDAADSIDDSVGSVMGSFDAIGMSIMGYVWTLDAMIQGFAAGLGPAGPLVALGLWSIIAVATAYVVGVALGYLVDGLYSISRGGV